MAPPARAQVRSRTHPDGFRQGLYSVPGAAGASGAPRARAWARSIARRATSAAPVGHLLFRSARRGAPARRRRGRRATCRRRTCRPATAWAQVEVRHQDRAVPPRGGGRSLCRAFGGILRSSTWLRSQPPSAATGARRSGTPSSAWRPQAAPSARWRRSRRTRGRCRWIEAEHAREGGLSHHLLQRVERALRRRGVLARHEQRELELAGALIYSVSRHRPSDFRPIAVVHLATRPRSSSGSPMNAANEARASPRAVAPRAGGARAPLVPRTSCAARGSTFPRTRARSQRYMVEAETSNCPRAPPRCAPAKPARDVRPDSGHHRFRLALVAVDARARRRQLLVGHRLGPGGGVLDPPALRAVVAAQLAAVAAARPRQQPRAGVAGRLAGPAAPLPGPATPSGCATPRRPRSRASSPAPQPSACTTCACPVRSRSRPCQPCPSLL